MRGHDRVDSSSWREEGRARNCYRWLPFCYLWRSVNRPYCSATCEQRAVSYTHNLRDRTAEWLETVTATAIVQWLTAAATVTCKGKKGACFALWTWPPGTWPNDDRLLRIWHNSYVKTHMAQAETRTQRACVLFACLINLPSAGIAGKCNFFIYTCRYWKFADVCTAYMSNQLYCPLAHFDILINVYLYV